MLPQTQARLERLPERLRDIVEEVAMAIMMSALSEDIIPPERARAIVEDHRADATEDWRRAMAEAVAALETIHKLGYSLARRDTADTDHLA